MAITSYLDFVNNYLVKNGMIGNATNMNKAPDQLKIELDEINAVVGTKADALDSAVVIPIGTTLERPVLGSTDAAIRFNTDTDVLEEWNGTQWRNITTSLTLDIEGGLLIPRGNTASRPVLTAEQVAIRYNTDLSVIEEWNGTEWMSLAGNGIATGGLLLPVGPTSERPVLTAEQAAIRFNTDLGVIEEWDRFIWKPLTGSGELGTTEFIVKPVITFPLNGATEFNTDIQCSYATSSYFAGAYDWVNWEVSTNALFTNIIASYAGDSNLNAFNPNIGTPNQLCYVRVKQGSDNHRSEWSNTIAFTTPNIYVETPTFTVTGEMNGVPSSPTITSSAFTVYNGTDTHDMTDWIVENSSNTVVWSSLGDTTNKTSITVPNGILSTNSQYTFKVKYYGVTYGGSGTASKSVTTLASFTATPVVSITSSMNESSTAVGTITNYDAAAIYTITANIGTITYTSGSTFTYDSPSVASDTVGTISIYATVAGNSSVINNININILNILVTADAAVSISSFSNYELNEGWLI